MAKNGVSVKLLIDKQSNKVLFAEGGKDFVDFLFHFLSLPVGSVVRLLTKEAVVGCVGNLYSSIEELSDDYMQPALNKDTLLNPYPTSSCLGKSPLLQIAETPASSTTKKFYSCSSCYSYMSDGHGAMCPSCRYQISNVMTYIAPPENAGVMASSDSGYVKGLVMYMIMDDLVVKPMPTLLSVTLLNKFNVKDVTSLDEKVVRLGLNEGLALLKASLETNTVLTKVFLEREQQHAPKGFNKKICAGFLRYSVGSCFAPLRQIFHFFKRPLIIIVLLLSTLYLVVAYLTFHAEHWFAV